MDYQLAKELKDAGFPQRGRLFIAPDGSTYDWMELRTDGIICPTLSELIEACGDVENFSLQHLRDDWWAGSSDTDRISEYTLPSGRGSTPDIAVARLWLTLHKK